MAGEAVVSPMRLATAPGRFARPAPPGNDDPCGERRTILEGMPSRPERPPRRRLRRAVLMVRRKACIRQRQARARARNPTWSAARRASPSPGTQDASTQIELGRSVCANRSHAGASLRCAMNARRALPGCGSREASACRSWHADLGASQASKRHRRSARPSRGGGEKRTWKEASSE